MTIGRSPRSLALPSRARRLRMDGASRWRTAGWIGGLATLRLAGLVVLLLFASPCSAQSPPTPQPTAKPPAAQAAAKSAAKPAAKSAAQPAPGVARTQIDRGLIKVTVEVQPSPARLSDEPTLTLTIDSARGVVVDKPPFGEAIGGFVIRDFREPLPETQGDREIRRQIYTLEPVQTGTQHLDPITVTFTDRRPQGDGKRHTVQTESLAVEVTSMLEAEVPSLDQLKPLAGPLELPSSPSRWLAWLGGGLLALVLAAGVGWWLVRRRRRLVPEKPLTPHELAYLELEALVQENLSGTDVKLFYVRLTGIVRRFIERTTGVHAPEQTTEEFLRVIGCGQLFPEVERARLKAFLESADLVKFAAQEPTAADIEQTFRRAQAFLGLQPQEAAA